jgi:hypothetical protein
MTNKSLSLALILAALTLSTVASCGGDDEGGGSGAGGSAGAGAGGSSGTSGVGGTSGTSGAGGAAGTSNVGGTSGGTSGTGGAGGTGAGGTGGSDAGGEGGMMGMNQQLCPAAQPTNGAACEPARGDCEFGDNVCDCVNDSDIWVCWNPATDCPTETPAYESTCPTVGIECEYGEGRDGNDCDCTDDGWECDDDFGGDDDGGI